MDKENLIHSPFITIFQNLEIYATDILYSYMKEERSRCQISQIKALLSAALCWIT